MSTLTLIAYIYTLTLMTVSLLLIGVTLPSVVREGNVRNGLRNYRKIFLVSGTALFFLGILTTAILTTRFFLPVEVYRLFGAVVLMLFSTVFCIVAFALRKMYTYNFTPEQKALHEKMEALEDGTATIVHVKKKV